MKILQFKPGIGTRNTETATFSIAARRHRQRHGRLASLLSSLTMVTAVTIRKTLSSKTVALNNNSTLGLLLHDIVLPTA